MRFISRFGRFHEDFTLKEGTVPLHFSRNRPENHSHNLGKALSKGLGLLKTGSLSLSIPFTSLSLYLSYLSLPLYISPSNFLSLSLLLSLFSLLFSLAYLMDVFVLVLIYILLLSYIAIFTLKNKFYIFSMHFGIHHC